MGGSKAIQRQVFLIQFSEETIEYLTHFRNTVKGSINLENGRENITLLMRNRPDL